MRGRDRSAWRDVNACPVARIVALTRCLRIETSSTPKKGIQLPSRTTWRPSRHRRSSVSVHIRTLSVSFDSFSIDRSTLNAMARMPRGSTEVWRRYGGQPMRVTETRPQCRRRLSSRPHGPVAGVPLCWWLSLYPAESILSYNASLVYGA